MSRSKSRWKGALLATVAGAAITPLAAKATMTIDLSLTPLGPASSVGYSLKYLTADTTSVPIYVYATITGTGTPATSAAQNGTTTLPSNSGDFNGLQYVYYNVNNSATNPVQGNISGGTLNPTLGFDSSGYDVGSPFNQSGGIAAQAGTVQNVLNGVSVGMVSGGSLTDYAKPRAAQPVWSNGYSVNNSGGVTSFADGTNIVPGAPNGTGSAHSVSFLLETLTYTPSWSGTPGNFNASTPASVQSTNFSIGVPTLPTGYANANIFTDSTSSAAATPASLSSVTTSNYSAGASVTLTAALKGDTNGDGIVNIIDFSNLLSNYGKPGGWAQGNFEEGSYSVVNIVDFSDLLSNYTKFAGPNPAVAEVPLYDFAVAHDDVAGFIAAGGVVPVPEPTSIGLLILSGSALLSRRSRQKNS